jgi:hypothetical protein
LYRYAHTFKGGDITTDTVEFVVPTDAPTTYTKDTAYSSIDSDFLPLAGVTKVAFWTGYIVHNAKEVPTEYDDTFRVAAIPSAQTGSVVYSDGKTSNTAGSNPDYVIAYLTGEGITFAYIGRLTPMKFTQISTGVTITSTYAVSTDIECDINLMIFW